MTVSTGTSGINVVLKVNTGTEGSPTWTEVGGQKDATINRSATGIDTTGKDGGGYKEFVQGLKEWSVDADAVYQVGGDAGYEALETAYENGTEIQVQMEWADGTIAQGAAIVTDAPIKTPIDDAVVISVKLMGTGPLTKTDAYVVTPTILNPTAGETDVPVEDTFTTSAFAVSTGSDTHLETQWQITLSADTTFATPVLDDVTTVELESMVIAAGILSAGTTEYIMRVRYRGTALGWSDWSAVTTFTTVA